MSEQKRNEKPNISVYSQLSSILNEVKSEKISINDAMAKIQLKESAPMRPYCKVTSSGSLALYGVTKQPIVLYPEQWNKLSKVIKSGYLENYIKYNESRLKYKPKYILKRPQQQSNNNIEEDADYDEDVIPREGVENI